MLRVEFEEVCAAVVVRLGARRVELENAIFVRARDLAPGAAGLADPKYLAGLRAASTAAVDFVLDGLEHEGQRRSSVAVPPEVTAQACRAARAGVGLDTVLRRYVAGLAVLEDFIVQEASHGDFADQRTALRGVLEASVSLLDRLIPAVAGAYTRELERAAGAPAQRGRAPGSPDRGIAAGIQGDEGRAGPGPGPGRQEHGQDTGQSGKRGAALPATLGAPSTRRARECLLFLAEHPDSSNREVALGIDIAHQSHISRLLAHLHRQHLVSRRSEGRGKRNAWRLTPRGEEMARALSGRGG